MITTPDARVAAAVGIEHRPDPMPADYPGTEKQWAVETGLHVSGGVRFCENFAEDGYGRVPAGKVRLDGTFTAADLRLILDALENP